MEKRIEPLLPKGSNAGKEVSVQVHAELRIGASVTQDPDAASRRGKDRKQNPH